jgi:hypothetical protein
MDLPPGTYRDYEQGRSKPPRIVERGIVGRIADYEEAYAEYLLKQRDERQAAVSAAT